MTAQDMMVTVALKSWNQALDRATQLCSNLTDEELQAEVAPGRNRLIYLWGHLAATSDSLIATLRLGQRLHPELDATFLKSPDRAVAELPSAAELKRIWEEINANLTPALAQLSAEEWLERHASVSEEDFVKEPLRNRFAILLSRTNHLGFHLGQVVLTKKRG